MPFCDGCVNVWLWHCALTHFIFLTGCFLILLIWPCRLFVCFSVRICSHPQARPGEAEHCEGDSGGLPAQRGGVLHQGDSDPHHEWAERRWVLTMKTLRARCVLAAHISAVRASHFRAVLMHDILLLLIFNTNSCLLLCSYAYPILILLSKYLVLYILLIKYTQLRKKN